MPGPHDDFTLLRILGPGIAPYSTRGATQTLEPISQAAVMRRTARGVLRNLGSTKFRWYQTSISCTDLNSPGFSQWFPGMAITIHSIAELCYADISGNGPARPAVADSERTENGFVFYRPIIEALITSFNFRKDEYGGPVGWTLVAEEIGA